MFKSTARRDLSRSPLYIKSTLAVPNTQENDTRYLILRVVEDRSTLAEERSKSTLKTALKKCKCCRSVLPQNRSLQQRKTYHVAGAHATSSCAAGRAAYPAARARWSRRKKVAMGRSQGAACREAFTSTFLPAVSIISILGDPPS